MPTGPKGEKRPADVIVRHYRRRDDLKDFFEALKDDETAKFFQLSRR